MSEETKPEGTTESPAALTPEAVEAIVNSRINNFVHSQKTDIAKLKTEVSELRSTSTVTAAQTTTATATPDDTKMSVLERQVKELQDQNRVALEKAAAASRDNALGKALSGYQFANDAARDIAHRTFAADIKEMSDGQYAIGDQPLSDGIKARMANMEFLLTPKKIGGSGAASGNAVETDHGYRKGMTRAEQQELVNRLSKQF